MMRGRKTAHGYNNGFSLEEPASAYHARLKKVVALLATLMIQRPALQIMALQEAPITKNDIRFFHNELMRHAILRTFALQFSDPRVVTSWGLMTLVNTQRIKLRYAPSVWSGKLSVFNERAQIIRITPVDDKDSTNAFLNDILFQQSQGIFLHQRFAQHCRQSGFIAAHDLFVRRMCRQDDNRR